MFTQPTENIRISDVMLNLDEIPVVPTTMFLKQALEKMGQRRLGIVCIVDESGKLQGIFTDGDVRRKLLEVQKPFSAFFSDDVIDHAVTAPSVVQEESSLAEAVQLMEEKEVWDLPVVSAAGKLIGLLHLHPVVKLLMHRD